MTTNSLLTTKLFFPCNYHSNRRHLMAVYTGSSEKGIRLVAFPTIDSATAAIEAVRRRDLKHVVGPKLINTIQKRKGGASDDGVMEGSPMDISHMGFCNFVLDVCEFKGPNVVEVDTSYTFQIMPGTDMVSDAFKSTLEDAWEP